MHSWTHPVFRKKCTTAAKHTLAILAAALLLSSPVHAGHPLATDDTGTLGTHRFQLETSAEFGWDNSTADGSTTRTVSQTLNTVITAGLFDPLDLVLTLPFSWQQVRVDGRTTYDDGGLNDLTLELKWRILEAGPVSIAIKPALSIPSGDYARGLGSARPAYGVNLISTFESRPFAVHFNAGITHRKYTDGDRTASRENLLNVSVAGSVEPVKGLQFVAEAGTMTNPVQSVAAWPVFVAGGGIYSVMEDLDLSLGVRGGLTSPQTDVAILTGLTFRLP